MSTTKLEHVIGRDGLHRLRLTAINGEIIGNSHEGMSSKENAIQNEVMNFDAGLVYADVPKHLRDCLCIRLEQTLHQIPTVDERDSEPVTAEPAADSLRHERVFGKPADPFEPQTPGPVEPQLR